MNAMRTLTIPALLIPALLVVAAPAAAQPATQFQLDELRMQQEAAQRRAIDQSNQLMSLEARLRAERAADDLQRLPPRPPQLTYDAQAHPPAPFVAQAYPSMPASVLADSNRRVQEAAQNRR